VGKIAAVLAADDGYAMPLAVAARSVVAPLPPGTEVTIAVLDMGISDGHRERIEGSLDLPGVELRWVDSLRDRITDLPNTWPIITRAGYGRIFIPEVLPDIERALYLDCDVLVRRSVAGLFDLDMGGAWAMGVLDVQAPFVPFGVPHWYAVGRSADELNFNSGVLLMDLAEWRERDLTRALLDYFTGRLYLRAQDQEGVNAVLGGHIAHLDPRWNQQAEIFWDPAQYHYEDFLPFPAEICSQVRGDPWIVHFSSHPKPWDDSCRHPFLSEWFATLDLTEYAGWRPRGPSLTQLVVRSWGRSGLRVGRRIAMML
jgi:lipopolysaccharide biosynthesis glycosyltransferase